MHDEGIDLVVVRLLLATDALGPGSGLCPHNTRGYARWNGGTLKLSDDSNMKAWVPSATRTGVSSSVLALAKHAVSGPWGVIMLCRLAPPGRNPYTDVNMTKTQYNYNNKNGIITSTRHQQKQ